MDIPKTYRLGYAGMAIQLLRPLAVDFSVTGEFDPEKFAFLEWNDPRPQPDAADVVRVMLALRAVEDAVEPVYTDEQLKIFADAQAAAAGV